MGFRFGHHLGPVGAIDPGQYTTDKPCVFLSCPRCGGIDDISVANPPGRYGVLSYEWKCPTVTCGWKDFVTLDCWNEEPHR